MPSFRKKPVVIQAVQWTGANVQELTSFLAGFGVQIASAADDEEQRRKCIAVFDYRTASPKVLIRTLEGLMMATAGDWIIRSVKGELYPCKPEIFEATYEPAEAPPRPPASDVELLDARKAVREAIESGGGKQPTWLEFEALGSLLDELAHWRGLDSKA